MKVVVTHASKDGLPSTQVTDIENAQHHPSVTNGVLSLATDTGRYTFAAGHWLSAVSEN